MSVLKPDADRPLGPSDSDRKARADAKTLNRLTFWAELVGTGGLGALLFFTLDAKDLGQIAWMVGTLLIAHRYLIDVRLRQERKVVSDKIHGVQTHIDGLTSEISNLRTFLAIRSEIEVAGQDSNLQDMHSAVETFFSIREPELEWLRNEQLEQFSTTLRMLDHDKRSRVLHRGEYYKWLLPEIENAPAGSEIWAVSRMMDCEWDDSPEELAFLQLNLQAAARGVHVTRLFLCEKDVWQEATNTLPPVQQQLAHGGTLDAYFGDLASIQRRDPAILAAIGSGLFAFDNRVVLVDQHSDDGSARGYVSANPGEIRTLRSKFDSLRHLCIKQTLHLPGP